MGKLTVGRQGSGTLRQTSEDPSTFWIRHHVVGILLVRPVERQTVSPWIPRGSRQVVALAVGVKQHRKTRLVPAGVHRHLGGGPTVGWPLWLPSLMVLERKALEGIERPVRNLSFPEVGSIVVWSRQSMRLPGKRGPITSDT